MNRGNLAEDPRAGLPSSSRYSRAGAQKNALLYVDVRGRKGKKADRGSGKTTEGNHNYKETQSVGRSLAESHMDRLEVGSDGRLFGVRENPSKKKAAHSRIQINNTEPETKVPADPAPINEALPGQAAPASVQPPLVQTEGFLQQTEEKKSAKPVREYLVQQENPLFKKQKHVRGTANTLRQGASIPARPATSALGRWKMPLLAGLTAAAIMGYAWTAWHFHNRFYPGTEFFGIKAFNLSVYDVKAAIRDKVDSYELELITRQPEAGDKNISKKVDVNQNIIKATDIDMIFADNGQVDRTMRAQRSWLWPVMMIVQNMRSKDEALETQYDPQLVEETLDGLSCFDEKTVIAPQNARVALTDDGAVVEPEVYGTQLDPEATKQAVLGALDAGLTQLDLDRVGLYENPTVFGSDLRLVSEAQELNLVLGAKVTIPFGDREEVVNSEAVRTFLEKVHGAYRINTEKVNAYVDTLAERYDTYGKARTFYTSIGTSVKLDGSGDYGWELDREAMSEALLDAVQNQKIMTLEPVYTREAYCRSANDLGDTYVEINITDQTMWFYREGKLIVKTPVVTGNPYAGHATPSGSVWAVKGRFRNQVLSGEDYAAPVDYWMPFNGGVGIHDLQSRWYFGGTVYMGSGSHGCINTPLSAVKLVYANIEEGVPVIVYEDDSETAQALMTGPVDSATIKAQVEEEFGTVEDDGSGSIVYWTAQQKAAGLLNT